MSTSSQLEPPVTITETSESMSRETTPIRDLEDLSKVKLSLWLQWTLPKLICSVYSKDALSQGRSQKIGGFTIKSSIRLDYLL